MNLDSTRTRPRWHWDLIIQYEWLLLSPWSLHHVHHGDSILFCMQPRPNLSPDWTTPPPLSLSLSPSHSLWMSLTQVQGMSSMAAMLMLNMDEVEAFISFSNLINRPCQLAFYRVDHQLVHTHICLSILVRTLVVMMHSIAPNPNLNHLNWMPEHSLFCLSVDAQVFRGLPGVLWGDSSSSLPSLSVFRSDSWPLPHGLVSFWMTADHKYSQLQRSGPVESREKLLA